MSDTIVRPTLPDNRPLTDAEACEFLSITSRTLRLWRHTRGLPHIKITNREIRYRRSDIEDWLDRARTVIA